MHPRQFARYGGIVMLFIGVAALFSGLSTAPEDAGMPILNLESSYGMFLGLFPMNIINKLVLIGFGLAGIYCASRPTTSLPASIRFSRAVLYVMGAGAILGIIPATNTFFGYWPLYGGEIAVHAIFAILGGYFGFALSSRAMEENRHRFPSNERKAS